MLSCLIQCYLPSDYCLYPATQAIALRQDSIVNLQFKPIMQSEESEAHRATRNLACPIEVPVLLSLLAVSMYLEIAHRLHNHLQCFVCSNCRTMDEHCSGRGLKVYHLSIELWFARATQGGQDQQNLQGADEQQQAQCMLGAVDGAQPLVCGCGLACCNDGGRQAAANGCSSPRPAAPPVRPAARCSHQPVAGGWAG